MTLNHQELAMAGDILIVDDSPENLKFLKDTLTSKGYRVRPARSGDLALQSVQAKLPILILLDIRMPEMDGFEVCRRLKADETTKGIPIIFASALSETSEKIKGFELGAVDYVTKPLNTQEILMRVATHVSLFIAQQQLENKNRQLQLAELRYRTVADFTYNWETWIAPDGQWLYCSPSCKRITGYDVEDFIKRPRLFLDIVNPVDKASLIEHLRLVNATDCSHESCTLEYRLLRKDRREIWIEHICQAVYDDSGVYLGRRASSRDITEQKKAETILIQEKKRAEAANIAKSTFIATMSHELRTPLNAILGFSELMVRDEAVTEQQKETLNIINRSGAHLLSIINDVLDISKIESGRIELEVQAFDLIKFLQEIGEMINVRAIGKQLSFCLNIATEMPRFVKADCNKLRQILINLLGNAIKFTQHGTVTLHAHSQPLSNEMVMLTIEIIDSGIGISADKQKELFKPFVQLAQSSLEAEGTGLGLAISKSLVELMDGKISVSSQVNIGSTFTIELPVASTTVMDVTFEKEEYQTVKSLALNQPEWRLLVVDDNMDNRLLLATLLNAVGFQVREAENGQEAVCLFEQWHPHLIFMDMRMPTMDGYEATQKIRQLAKGDEVKIIALTASAFKEQHCHIINAGCDAVLHKPFHIPEIFTTLNKQLGVEFVYQKNTPVTTSLSTSKITAEMLSAVPLDLRQQLDNAALKLDIEEIEMVIAQIHAIEPEIANSLDMLAKGYQFEQIILLNSANIK